MIFDLLGLLYYTIIDGKGISRVVRLSATHAFNDCYAHKVLCYVKRMEWQCDFRPVRFITLYYN